MRQIEVSQLFFALLQNRGGIDHPNVVKQIPRPVRQEPENDQVDNDRDPEELPQSSLGSLVFQLAHDIEQLVAFQAFVTYDSGIPWRFRRRAWRIGWDFGDGHSERFSGRGYGSEIPFILSYMEKKPISFRRSPRQKVFTPEAEVIYFV
jgi:hypothetical protein